MGNCCTAHKSFECKEEENHILPVQIGNKSFLFNERLVGHLRNTRYHNLDENKYLLDDSDSECPICFENEMCVTLGCKHNICSECIINWANSKKVGGDDLCVICKTFVFNFNNTSNEHTIIYVNFKTFKKRTRLPNKITFIHFNKKKLFYGYDQFKLNWRKKTSSTKYYLPKQIIVRIEDKIKEYISNNRSIIIHDLYKTLGFMKKRMKTKDKLIKKILNS